MNPRKIVDKKFVKQVQEYAANGKSQRQIARLMSVSQSYISRLLINPDYALGLTGKRRDEPTRPSMADKAIANGECCGACGIYYKKAYKKPGICDVCLEQEPEVYAQYSDSVIKTRDKFGKPLRIYYGD